jgi:helicase required for RNAi-mediated heterochromatin assembly 1
LSDVPRPEELLRNDVEIPTNVVKGAYESVDEYLGTNYELVREDTLAGLRAAIAHVRKYPECDDTSEIALYENVSTR